MWAFTGTSNLTPMTKLTVNDAMRLNELESVIERGRGTFIAVGNALSEIRDSKLYRKDFPSFEVYTERRWGLSKPQAYRLIQAADVVKEVSKTSPIGTTVQSEGAARELVKVPPERRISVLERAVANGSVTAKSIAKAAAVPPPTIEIDATGWPIPVALTPLWKRGEDIDSILHYLSKLKSGLRAAQESQDMLWAEVNFSSVLSDLEKAWTSIQCAKPYAVCTQCQGHPEVQPKGQCPLCKGRGFISKFRWEILVPEEIKAMRKKGLKK